MLSFALRTVMILFPNLIIDSSEVVRKYPALPRRDVEQAVIQSNLTSLPSKNVSNNLKAYGLMFDVRAAMKIRVTDLHIYTKEIGFVAFQVYTVNGSHLKWMNLNDWTLVASGPTDGLGLDESTSIPGLTPIIINANEEQGFYITLVTEDLIYLSTNKEVGDVLVENQYASVLVGGAVADYPFNREFKKHSSVWCGYIGFSSEETSNTSPPSPFQLFNLTMSQFPTSMPSFYEDTLNEMSIETSFTFYGRNMNEMDKKTNTCFEEKQKEKMENYFIENDNVVQFVSLSTIDQPPINSYVHEIIVKTTIKTKIETSDPSSLINFIMEDSSTILDELKYNCDSYFSQVIDLICIATPFNYQKFHPFITNQTLEIHGQEVVTMDHDSKIYFENTLKEILIDSLVKVNSNTFVLVSNVAEQTLFTSKLPFLRIVVFVYGKFLSPPFYVPSKIIESCIDEKQLDIINQLKESRIKMFQNLERISSTRTPLKKETPQSYSSDEGEFDLMKFLLSPIGIGVVIFGGFILILCAIKLITCCFCKRDTVTISRPEVDYAKMHRNSAYSNAHRSRSSVNRSSRLHQSTRSYYDHRPPTRRCSNLH